VIDRLTDPDEDVRATAAVALAKMGATRAIGDLQRMEQTDTNQETQMNGVATLNSVVAHQAIEVLLKRASPSAMVWPE
jgi:HEAT repeat protein